MFAHRLQAFFPPGAAVDLKVFTTGLVEVLGQYPRWLLEKACSPSKGIPAHNTFLPSLADVRAYCQGLLEAEERHAELMARNARPALPEPVDRSNRPTLEELQARYGPNWGIGKGRRERYQPRDLVDICRELGIDVDSIPDDPQAGKWSKIGRG